MAGIDKASRGKYAICLFTCNCDENILFESKNSNTTAGFIEHPSTTYKTIHPSIYK